MMKKNKIVFIFIIFVTIIFLAYSYSRKNDNIEDSVSSSRSVSVLPLPTGSGKITNPQTWSKYTFNHDFTIAYPAGWNVVINKDGSSVNFMTSSFHQDDEFSMPYGNSSEVIYTIFGEKDTSDIHFKNGYQFPSETSSETMIVTNLKQIHIGSYPAVEFDYYPTDNTHFLRTRIAILKDHKMYRFDAVYAQDAGVKLFEQMINSITFIQ